MQGRQLVYQNYLQFSKLFFLDGVAFMRIFPVGKSFFPGARECRVSACSQLGGGDTWCIKTSYIKLVQNRISGGR